jgi:hypothetical protein
MAFVIVRHGASAPAFHRQSRLSAVECLYLALFIHRENNGVRRGINVKTNNMSSKMSAIKIVPRWEWRCFAPSLATIAQAVAIPSDAASQESDEIYLLGPRGTENAKIRDGALDIKRLRQIDADGLELWEPVFKARFPLSRSDLAAASAVWPLPLETQPRETYMIEQFFEEVISLRADSHIVRVHKSRRAFTFAGCIAELVRLVVESRTLESFSLEHEDPTRVLAALRTLGLDSHANTNYSLGLKRALGLEHATTELQEGFHG